MTLPFRRRHHDDEAGHDRARTLLSNDLLEPLDKDDSAWLVGHLATCGACSRDREAYLADRELLRSLRDRAPEPPRDLWARTEAALEREAGRRPRGARQAPTRGRSSWRGLPLGAAAGAVIVLVVIATSGPAPIVPPSGTPGSSSVAAVTPPIVAPTPITLTAVDPVGWLRSTPDGKWEFFLSDVNEVCPRSEPDCGPGRLPEGPARPVGLGGKPVSLSPNADHVVFESDAASGAGGVYVVPVAVDIPPPTAEPSDVPETVGPPTAEPGTASPPTAEPSVDPSTPGPTPAATPIGQLEIASGVTVVGDVAYSQDGKWLAFSARPIDGSTGPDLYLWSVGASTAEAVTTDHRTYFSAWLGNQVLASTVVADEPPAPIGSDAPSSEAPATEVPATEAPAPDASASAEPAAPIEARPASFLLDPATRTRIDFAQPDVWLPVVDSTGRFVTYWSGSVRSADGLAWDLGSGQLLLDRWSNGEPAPAAESAAAESAAAESVDPSGTPEAVLGPLGAGVEIVPAPVGAFKVRFDLDGTHLAVWVAEHAADDVGFLSLLVVDPETGGIDPGTSPLVSEPALRRFSIDAGRLAWVSPDGQDGEQSAVRVLAWINDDFGQIQTLPAKDLYIVR